MVNISLNLNEIIQVYAKYLAHGGHIILLVSFLSIKLISYSKIEFW